MALGVKTTNQFLSFTPPFSQRTLQQGAGADLIHCSHRGTIHQYVQPPLTEKYGGQALKYKILDRGVSSKESWPSVEKKDGETPR